MRSLWFATRGWSAFADHRTGDNEAWHGPECADRAVVESSERLGRQLHQRLLAAAIIWNERGCFGRTRAMKKRAVASLAL